MSDATELHAQQIAYWNGAGGAAWVNRQTRLDAGLAPVAEAAIAHARVQPGETVLDIGCGCGATALALSDVVGPTGHVTGLDVSEPMLALARERAGARANLDFLLADASTSPLPAGQTDLLFSRFGVMFFGDPVAAFRNLHQALRPEGRLAFACWRPFDENPWMRVPLQAVQTLLPPMPRPGPEDPGPFAFANPDRVTRILTAAGFDVPTFTRFDFQMNLAPGGNLDDAAQEAAEFGPASRLLLDQSDELRAQGVAAIRAALEPYARDGKVQMPAAVWLVEVKGKAKGREAL